jgi:integrase
MQARPNLLDQVRRAIRARHFSPRTEEAYVHWVRRFVRFHGLKHPEELGDDAIASFLAALASDAGVSASTHNQAMSALLFLYREVLGRGVHAPDRALRIRASPHVPVVLTREEVRRVLEELAGAKRLVASLLYGAGLRLLEALCLRVEDLDLERCEIIVRSGKGGKDRITMLPESARPAPRRHIEQVRACHNRDLAAGGGWVELPQRSAKSPRGRTRLAVAMALPGLAPVHRNVHRPAPPPAPPRDRHAARRPRRRPPQRYRETGILPHLPPLLRHPSTRGRLRHPHHPGASRPQQRPYHHDLHHVLIRGGRGVRSPADRLFGG